MNQKSLIPSPSAPPRWEESFYSCTNHYLDFFGNDIIER
jgi:hypothetical protein